MTRPTVTPSPPGLDARRLTHLRQLEAESIHILREVAAELERPVMLYSIGKDSSVMVRLAQKAFAPGPLPFPLLHIDTTWKFRAMYEFRDRFCADHGLRLLVHQNRRGVADGVVVRVSDGARVGDLGCRGDDPAFRRILLDEARRGELLLVAELRDLVQSTAERDELVEHQS